MPWLFYALGFCDSIGLMPRRGLLQSIFIRPSWPSLENRYVFWCEIQLYIFELNIFMYFMYFEQNGGCFHMKFINMWTKIPVKKSYETLAPSSILLSFSISHLPLFCFAQAGIEVLKSWSAWVRVSSVYVTGMLHLLLYLENIFNHVKNPCSSYKT